ncbi:TPA: hypothetical protein ACN30R_004038 [Vibrio parahaemolyticus]
MSSHREAMYPEHVGRLALIAMTVDQGGFSNGRFDEWVKPTQIWIFSTTHQELIDMLGNEVLVNWVCLESRFNGVVHDLSRSYAPFLWISGSSL